MTTPITAIVVGGGIGGAAAAHALLRAGLTVRVHERAHHIAEVGAGLGLGVNGAHLLEQVGLGHAVAAAGAEFGGARLLRCDGVPITDPDAEPGPRAGAGGDAFSGVRGIHRADLLALLLDALPAAVVHTGRRCVAVEQDSDRARVRFEDGTSDEADLVVGADGIHSSVQLHVVTPTPPTFSGIVAYRGLVRAADIPEWPTELVAVWLGEGRTFIAYPVRHGALINIIGLVPTDEHMSESWSAPGDPDRLRAEFAGWDPRLGALLDRVEQTYRWGLYDRDPLERWTSGRITLLGDAAHPMLPFMGQGANQAIEDGAGLAVLLNGLDRADVPDALRAYQRLRLPRTSAIQQQSRRNGALFTNATTDPAGIAQRERNLQHSATSMPWVTEYHVDDEAVSVRAGQLGRSCTNGEPTN